MKTIWKPLAKTKMIIDNLLIEYFLFYNFDQFAFGDLSLFILIAKEENNIELHVA